MTSFCHREGVLVLTAGTYGNVLRFLPPLTMPEPCWKRPWASSTRPCIATVTRMG